MSAFEVLPFPGRKPLESQPIIVARVEVISLVAKWFGWEPRVVVLLPLRATPQHAGRAGSRQGAVQSAGKHLALGLGPAAMESRLRGGRI